MDKKIVSVTGLGKVGLPLAAIIAHSGHEVMGIDINPSLCKQIEKRENPFPEEKDLGNLLKQLDHKAFSTSLDFQSVYQKATIHIVIVPLFLNANFDPDFSTFDVVIKNIGKGLKNGDLVVIETTLPPETTTKRIKPMLEKYSKMVCGQDFYLAYSPERLMSGFAIQRFREFPKIIAGTDSLSGKKGFEFYRSFVPRIETVSSTTTAEIIKIAEGVYRDTVIALSNELFQITDRLGVDYQEVKERANHEYCHLLEAGIGVGGHCIPVYPWFLIKRYKEASLTAYVRNKNDGMIEFWVEKIENFVQEKKLPKQILVQGITFREGVKEIYHSRSIALIRLLKILGYKVYVQDRLFKKTEIKKLGFKPYQNQKISLIFDVFKKRLYENK